MDILARTPGKMTAPITPRFPEGSFFVQHKNWPVDGRRNLRKKHTLAPHVFFCVFFLSFQWKLSFIRVSCRGIIKSQKALRFDGWQDARIRTFDHHCHRHRRHDTSSDHPQGFCQAAKMMVMVMIMMMMMMILMILTLKRYYKSLELEHIIVFDDT